MVNLSCPIPRGRGVGGCSLINGIIYSRGSSLDFDRWAKEVKDSRWSYDQVLPYFKKNENYVHRDPNAPVNYSVHGEGGLWNVEYHLPRSPQLDAFLGANEELGYKIADINSGTGLGVSPVQIFTKNGRRCDVGTAFVLPALNRTNLTVLTNAYVTQILTDRNKTANRVLFSYKNKYYVVRSSKEVLLSAGSIQSPQLLMLSGIGPKQHLDSLNISVIQDLEIGTKLRDHPAYDGLNFGTNYSEPILPLKEYVNQFLSGVGPLASPGNLQGLGFYESQFTKGEK